MDFYHDNTYVGLRKLATAGCLPDWIKTASTPTVEEINSLPDQAFAWPERRLFPMQDRETTYVSAAYFLNKTASEQTKIPAHVKQNLSRGIYGWGLEADVRETAKTLTNYEKRANALTADDYGIGFYELGGSSQLMFPLLDAHHVKRASSHFQSHYRKYPIPWRAQIAASLVKKSRQFGAPDSDHPSVTLAYAGENVCDSVKLAEHLGTRSSLAAEGDLSVARSYLDLAHDCPGNMVDPVVLLKVATAVAYLDRQAGLDRLYDTAIPDPVLAVFNLPVKLASDATGSVVSVGGHPFSMSELLSAGPELYGDVLGADFLASVSSAGDLDPQRLSEILPTLPRDLQALLLKGLKGHMSESTA